MPLLPAKVGHLLVSQQRQRPQSIERRLKWLSVRSLNCSVGPPEVFFAGFYPGGLTSFDEKTAGAMLRARGELFVYPGERGPTGNKFGPLRSSLKQEYQLAEKDIFCD